MTKRIVLAGFLSALAMPASAADMFPNYWDRYAVKMSSELVLEDSETTPFFRNVYAVMSLDTARAEAVARAERKVVDRAGPGDAAVGSSSRTEGGSKRVCECGS